jgi:hypothetical protein
VTVLLAAMTVLLEGDVVVPRAHWRAVDVKVAQAGTIVKATMRAPENASRMHAYFITRENAERFARGGSLQPLGKTSFDDEGVLHQVAERAGDYILLLDNRISRRSDTPVRVTIELLPPAANVRTVPPERRRVVELASVLFVLAVVAYSARQLMK